MDAATVKALADSIADNLYRGLMPSWFWQIAVIAIAAGIGAFCGEFLKTRGKNLATKMDFDELKRQLETNTEVVEKIKSEFGRRDWAAREYANIRRIKLEELLNKMHECSVGIDRRRNAALEGVAPKEPELVSELEALAELYFPELRDEVDIFSRVCREQAIVALKYGIDVARAKGEGNRTDKIFDKFRSEIDYASLNNAKNKLITAAREVMTKTLNVESLG